MQSSYITQSDLLVTAAGLGIAYLVLTGFILPLLTPQAKYWRSQSWVGLKKQWMAQFRAGLSTVKNTRAMMTEGYQKFSKANKTFILPQLFGDPLVVLPASVLHEFMALPEDKVDPFTPNQEGIAMDYTVGSVGKEGVHSVHFEVVRRQLTRKLPLLTADVYDELVLGMKEQWPANEHEWTTVNAYPTCMKIVSRAANRVFAGQELCRTPEFLEHTRLYAVAVFKAAALIRLFPKVLHPIVGPYFARPIKHHLAICAKYATPVMLRRLQHIQNPVKDPSYQVPNDALQWMLEDCVKLVDKRPDILDPTMLCKRLMSLNMVAIHTTSMVTTNTLLDLYSSPNREDTVAGLREEVERVLRESGGEWSKNAINDMLRVDSTIRETMRITSLGFVGLPRRVSAPEGITLSGGISLPKGTTVVVPASDIQNDPAFFGADASQWNAFRFSAPREAYLAEVQANTGAKDQKHLDRILEQKNQSLIAVGDEFLAFGHSKHACPGRFFASQEMKLMIAYIVMTYDMKIDGGRPANWESRSSNIPTDTAQIQVRLRPTKA